MANILSLRVGDSIVERTPGGKKVLVPVKSLAFNACSKRGVHVNRNACYDNTAVVEIQQGPDFDYDDYDEEMEDSSDFPDGRDMLDAAASNLTALADRLVRV